MSLSRVVMRMRPVTQRGVAAMSTGSFDRKERAEETAYFNREEERAMRKLLAKMKKHVDHVEGDASREEVHTTERQALLQILGSHKLPGDVIDRLIDWKHDH